VKEQLQQQQKSETAVSSLKQDETEKVEIETNELNNSSLRQIAEDVFASNGLVFDVENNAYFDKRTGLYYDQVSSTQSIPFIFSTHLVQL
jgi:hypothetical protein